MVTKYKQYQIDSINDIPYPIFQISKKGILLQCNESAAELLGLVEPEEIIGVGYQEFAALAKFNAERMTEFIDNNQRVIASKQPSFTFEQLYSKTNNQMDNYLTIRYPLWSKFNELIGLVLSMVKVADDGNIQVINGYTNLSKVKEKSKPDTVQNTIDLEELIASMPGNVYWMNSELNYIGCNENVVKLLGISKREEIVGKVYEDFKEITGWNDGQLESFKNSDIKVMEGDAPLVNVEEPPVTDPEGKQIYYITNRVPLHNKVGEVIGVAGISIDITDKKRAEKLEREKRVAQETISQLKALSGSIAHQLTTPISSIGLSIEFLHDRFSQLINDYKNAVRAGFASTKLSTEDIQEVDEELRLITRGVEEAGYVIEHHLMNIKSSHKDFMLDLASLKKYLMSEIVEEALENFPFIENQAELIHWQCGEDFPIMADKGILIHVLYNLLDNALNSLRTSLKNNGKITIWLEHGKNGDSNRLHIKDNGLGLPREGRVDLFKPFKTNRENGTGLGLYFCKTVMKAHRGDITARGNLGKYAQFTLKFPMPSEFNRYQEKDYDRLFSE